MDETKHDGQALDWDSEIEKDDGKSFTVLPPGEYRFGVLKMEKTTSKKLRCPMAKLTLGIYALDDIDCASELAEIEDHLVLHETCEWKLCEFFRSVGDRKKGERIKPKWDAVPGAVGRCEIHVETFEKRDGKEGKSNKVKHYLDPEGRSQTPDAGIQKEAGGQKDEGKKKPAF